MTSTGETRNFQMDPKLLYDVIYRQAGALYKAILEGVMNSIDAKATKCVITLTRTELTISDDGIGMTERKQIEKFFETFGYPHAESEGKIYGTFRMGRGQLFAYGRNRWRTGPFEMLVDIKNDGLNYKLVHHESEEPGCSVRVMFYKELSTSDMLDTARTVKEWVKYAQIPVYMGKDRLSVDPASEKWDYVTDDAYCRLNSSSEVSIYNLGVYVCGLSNSRFGTGGVVVSRKQLKMNFARNDIQSDCPVWNRVRPFLVEKSGKAMKTESLTSYQRTHLVRKLMDWALSEDEIRDLTHEKKLITLSSGRAITISSLSVHDRYYTAHNHKVTWAKRGSMDGDRVTQHKLAVVISSETLTDFGFEESTRGLAELMKYLEDKFITPKWLKPHEVTRWEVVDISSFTAMLGISQVIAQNKWSPNQKVWVDFTRRMMKFTGEEPRSVHVGIRRGTLAWTDGSSNVFLEGNWLKNLHFNVEDMTRFLMVLLHEMAHSDNTENSHIHGVEFYERFDELIANRLPAMVHSGPLRLIESIESCGRTVSREAQWIANNSEKLEKAGSALRQKIADVAAKYEVAVAKTGQAPRKPDRKITSTLFDPLAQTRE